MEKNEYYKMYRFENDYWWYRGLHELVRHYVQQYKKKQADNPITILDAGCGTGRLMELLAPYGNIEGLDYSEDAISLCKERGLELAQQGDLNAWEAPPASYDIIVSNDVICTSGVEDDMAVLNKFYHALKENGLVILNLPAFMLLRRRHDIAVFGKRRYRKYQTLKQLQDIGFQPVRCGYRLTPLFFIMLLQKYLFEPFQKGEAVSDLRPLPGFINRTLLAMHRIDNGLFSAGIPVPLGSSLFVICSKK